MQRHFLDMISATALPRQKLTMHRYLSLTISELLMNTYTEQPKGMSASRSRTRDLAKRVHRPPGDKEADGYITDQDH